MTTTCSIPGGDHDGDDHKVYNDHDRDDSVKGGQNGDDHKHDHDHPHDHDHQQDPKSSFGGHDTINLGSGHDTVFQHGQASVYAQLGVTMAGGHHLGDVGGIATLVGGGHTSQFGDDGKSGFKLGLDTSAGGLSHDMTGSAGKVFAMLSSGHQVISNFVAGHDHLYLEGHDLAYLTQHHDVSSSGGNTFITLDGGATTIELKGVSSLHNADITTHK